MKLTHSPSVRSHVQKCRLCACTRVCVDVLHCHEHCPLSTERYWAAQPERLHSAEVSDEQVGIQQLQLGGKLTSAVGAHPPPHTVDGSLKKGGSSLLSAKSPHVKSLFPPAEIPSPVSWPSTPAALTVVRGGAVLRDQAL